MSTYILISLFAFAMSAVCGFIMIPQILSFCRKRKLYDTPNARKVHKNAIPRLGGVSFMPSMLIATVVALLAWVYTSKGNKIGVSPWSIFFGVGITVIYEIPPLVGAVLTVGVLVFIMNSINLIDGIDGLSASLTLIALSGLFFIFQHEKIWVYCILIAGLMGVLIPFLYHNIWGKQEKNQKIFMGDSGSLTLGYILGVLLIKFCMYNPHVMPYQKGATLLSVTLLLVPTFDVFRVIIVRILHHKPIFRADKNHIHHKLMRALLVTWIIAIDIIIYIAFHYTLDIFIRRKGGLPFTE